MINIKRHMNTTKINHLLKKIKGQINKTLTAFNNNKDLINTSLTFMLIIVSILIIIVTVRSYKTSDKISDIQIYLLKEKYKQITLTNILFSKNLLNETKWNKDELLIIVRDLEDMKTNTFIRPDYLRTSYIENAINKIEFGDLNLRSNFDNYLTIIKLVKDDLLAIQENYSANSKIKIERIDHTLKFAKSILFSRFENTNIDTLIVDIDKYIINQTNEFEKNNLQLEKY